MGFFSWLFGTDSATAAGDAATQQLIDRETQRYLNGEISREQYQLEMQHYNQNLTDSANSELELQNSFLSGLEESTNSFSEKFRQSFENLINAQFSAAWRLLPWQLKIGLLIFAGVMIYSWLSPFLPGKRKVNL